METTICTVVQEKTSKDFISTLNKYGVCIDFSNDYERSKASKGIFVGVISKVYDVVWKGDGGHLEHDTLFMSVKSLISTKRESQPFRVGFVGKIVSQLVEFNLKEGDAIGILKPNFFYALDIPTLGAGIGNVVVWVAKGLKDIGLDQQTSKSSDENQRCHSSKKQTCGIDNINERIPFIDEESDTHSLGRSSSAGTLQHDAQIYRSRPADLKKRTELPPNNKLVPDSTTRTAVQRCQNIHSENKIGPEILVSQNTANVGSADVSCWNENHRNLVCNLDSAVKYGNRDLGCSCHNVVNSSCGMNSHFTSCKTKCCTSKVNCCNCHPATHIKENFCSCSNNRTFCACSNNIHCSCMNSCCGHDTQPQCMHWNSAHSCRTNNSSCSRHCDHYCRSIRSCCGLCHCQIKQCCSSNCHNVCARSKTFYRRACHNFCSCTQEKINASENTRVPLCHASGSNSPQHTKPNSSNEEISVELSEDSHKKCRTKEWVHNWVGDPPHLLPEIEVSDHSGTSQNTSFELRPANVEAGQCSNDQGQSSLISSDPKHLVNPSHPVSELKEQKQNKKKRKLFSPLDNSTVISEKSVYCNSTIIAESTPFSSENHTDTPKEKGLSYEKNEEPKDNNISKNIILPLSNTISVHNNLVTIHQDPPVTEDVSPENNAQESSTNINHLQNKECRNSSEEQFPELRIDTPVISQVSTESQSNGKMEQISNKISQCESNVTDCVGGSRLKDNANCDQHHMESTSAEKMDINYEITNQVNNEVTSFQEVSISSCEGTNDSGTNDKCEAYKSDHVKVVTLLSKKGNDCSCSKSLALQDHSKSRASSYCAEMDFTSINDKTINKEKRSIESSDDTMELTCESVVMKRRKKDKFRKCKSLCSISSTKNANVISRDCTSSSCSYYDARSDGIISQKSNRWCLKPIHEVIDKPNSSVNLKIFERVSLQNCTSYNLNMFSTFNVVGAIIKIIPSISEEIFGSLVKGFCNEGCRKEHSYEDFKQMETIYDECTFCKYHYHLACPSCLIERGSKRPLCLFYSFEIHLFDGKNVFRIEIGHKSGVEFIGCTPQQYLKSDSLCKKIRKIIFSFPHDTWVNPILLKAKVKVTPKKGDSVLTLEGTSLRKDLTFKGKHYKL